MWCHRATPSAPTTPPYQCLQLCWWNQATIYPRYDWVWAQPCTQPITHELLNKLPAAAPLPLPPPQPPSQCLQLCWWYQATIYPRYDWVWAQPCTQPDTHELLNKLPSIVCSKCQSIKLHTKYRDPQSAAAAAIAPLPLPRTSPNKFTS